MENYEIKKVLVNALSLQDAYITSNNNHFQIIAVGKIFENMSRVKQQQAVYAPLMKYIIDNRIHALSIKTYTPQEWEHECKINNFKLV